MHWGSIFVETKLEDMNRIIIIGNGFDLAHNLKTKYEDFIDWYFGKWVKILKDSTRCYAKDELCEFQTRNNYECFYSYFYNCSLDGNMCDLIRKTQQYYGLRFMPCSLLERMLHSIETKGWVDIEADYYRMLVECKGDKEEVERLNKDFAVIQDLLVEYLDEIQKQKINEELVCEEIKNAILSPVFKRDMAVSSIIEWWGFVEERLKAEDTELTKILAPYVDARYMHIVRKDIQDFANKNYERIIVHGEEPLRWPDYFLVPDRVMLLNFNYTKTADLYLPKSTGFICNHIHGNLLVPETVIFGYGDESDDEYKKLQKFNDNEYLRHIKTNRYLETPNYRNLLSFIDSAPFQVCIMGHSCGLSDRTLLNTLFEHKNCVSIKPYYYVNEQGKDNYLDIVQNISRNFTNPQLMRDRVVNKTFCSPLPQKTKN